MGLDCRRSPARARLGVLGRGLHGVCPLTPLENHLRQLGGEAGYAGGFLAHYLVRVLYPPGLTWHIQWLLAALLLLINAVAYGGLIAWRRPRGA